MQDSIAKCLVFASEGRETVDTLISLLAQQGIGVTQSMQPSECLGSLSARHWRFLAIDASDETHNSLHVLSQARHAWPDIPVLVLVKRGDTHTAVQAMKAGAFDCVEAPIDAALLHSTVDTLDGHENGESDDLLHVLTRVEQIVLCRILDGRTNREIADALCRSPRTVEVHRRHIMQKLKASNLIDLVKRVMRANVIDDRFPARPSSASDGREPFGQSCLDRA